MSFFKNVLRWTRSRCKLTSFIILTAGLVIFYLIQMSYFNSYLNIKFWKSTDRDTDERNEKFKYLNEADFEGEKLIHFDLKGAPPKISYLLSLLPFLKKLGATGILVEYEDMFPYHSGLDEIAALNAYTLSDIAALLETAQLNNLTVIPLIPTFGHFEFVLKHERFREFREVEENPQSLCPSQENVYPLLQKMIEQVLAAHNTSKYLHIGCDEVDFLGMCPRCQRLMRKKKWPKDAIYFNHVRKIAEYIVSAHPHVKPIVWSDKFLKQNEKIIIQHRIPDLVDVMFWNYSPKKYKFPQAEDVSSFAKLFKDIWIANAFKGATGSTQIVTDIDYHLRNTIMWMEFVEEWREKLNFKGIAVTGWQRYNHFMGLCELFPVGIPSLASNLQMLNHRGLDNEAIKQSLNCNDFVPATLQEIQDLELLSRLRCDFPGYKVYRKIHSYYIMLLQLKKSLKQMERGDLTYYSILHNASNPTFIQELNKKSYKQQLVELDDLENEITTALDEVYDQYTISEWITTHMMPVRLRLQAAINMISTLSRARVWPRRPLENIEMMVKKIFDKICSDTEIRGCTLFNINI